MSDLRPKHLKEPSVDALMRAVMLALVPGTLLSAIVFGPSILINILISCAAALLIETIVLLLRKKSVLHTLQDSSALLTAWLFALTLPALVPWWISVCGIAAALLLGKHVYGGIGNNPFNPAMVGYAFVLISFPQQVTAWTAPTWLLQDAPGIIESLRITFNPMSLNSAQWDAITMATPLDHLKHAAAASLQTPVKNPLHGWIGAYAWEWINAAFLIGGLWMMARRLITWHIPLSLLLAMGSCYLLAWLIPGGQSMSPGFGLFSGAAMLGAFFIATDPVSAATSTTGRLIFGAGIGVLTYFIREYGGYPEGIAFAVLLMNLAAPTIDYYCQRDPL